MANANTPRGLQPYAYMSGAPWGGALRVYSVPSNNATALYLGDPVNLIGSSADANGVPNIVIATAGAGHQVLGAFMGIANNAGLLVDTLLQSQTPYLAADQAAYVYVCDDPFLLYWIQEDSIGGPMPAGAGGGNAELVAGSGSTVTSQSGWQLDSSTLSQAGSDATFQLRIIQALQEIDNAVGTSGSPEIGINAKWLVKINQGVSAFTNPNSAGT
jgi:hypothetical protein